jgi:hypothetical protein
VAGSAPFVRQLLAEMFGQAHRDVALNTGLRRDIAQTTRHR